MKQLFIVGVLCGMSAVAQAAVTSHALLFGKIGDLKTDSVQLVTGKRAVWVPRSSIELDPGENKELRPGTVARALIPIAEFDQLTVR